jgi:TRAP-type mannitol/chloroaromatic compound transport system permease small subunit
MDPDRVVAALRRLNTAVALAVGAAILGAAAFTLIDIAGRRLGAGLGGGEEIAGYVMAGATAWGMAYALTALAHVRIDIARARAGARGRALFDVLGVVALSAVAALVAFHGWSVLARSLANGSRANTAMETPLWIPQLIWFSGWVWFALCAAILSLCALWSLARGDHAAVERAAGVGGGET